MKNTTKLVVVLQVQIVLVPENSCSENKTVVFHIPIKKHSISQYKAVIFSGEKKVVIFKANKAKLGHKYFCKKSPEN